MADNTVLNTGTGGDSIRDIDRAGVKTQVAQIDIGGASAEKLVVAGQQTMANSLPVTLASDTGILGSVKVTDGITTAKVSAVGEQIVTFVDAAPVAQTITAQDIASVSTAGANAQSIITGTATAGSASVLTTSGDSSFSLLISGTWTGTLQFERSLDSGVTYTPVGAFSAGTSFITAAVTQNGAFHGNASSATNIRVRSIAAMTGTATVKLLAGMGGGTITVGNPLRLFDKVSGVEHTIKAASTSVIASDTALSVGLHPSSPLPAGTNLIGDINSRLFVPSADTAMQSAAATLINGSVLLTTGYGTSLLQVTGTFVGTVTFEGTEDGTNYVAVAATQLGASSISSTATIAGIYRVSVSGLTNIRARISAFTSGTITVVGRSTNAPFSGKFIQLVAGTNSIGTVQQAIITKGTQGATGVTTQDLKDSGRVNVAITAYQAAGIITTEALFAAATFSSSRDGAAASTGVQFAVTAGKRLRIQSIECGIKNNAAAAGTSKLVLRYAGAGGTITNASPILAIWDLGSNSVTAAQYIGPMVLPIPDGMELIPNSTFGFTNLSSAATMLHTISINGYEY